MIKLKTNPKDKHREQISYNEWKERQVQEREEQYIREYETRREQLVNGGENK